MFRMSIRHNSFLLRNLAILYDVFIDAMDVFELLNSHTQKFTLDNNVEIRKQSTFEAAEEPETESEKRVMTVLRLNEWL